MGEGRVSITKRRGGNGDGDDEQLPPDLPTPMWEKLLSISSETLWTFGFPP